jgi:hypothetical protein
MKRYGRPPASDDSRKFSVTVSEENARRVRAMSAETGMPITEIVDGAILVMFGVMDRINDDRP